MPVYLSRATEAKQKTKGLLLFCIELRNGEGWTPRVSHIGTYISMDP